MELALKVQKLIPLVTSAISLFAIVFFAGFFSELGSGYISLFDFSTLLLMLTRPLATAIPVGGVAVPLIFAFLFASPPKSQLIRRIMFVAIALIVFTLMRAQDWSASLFNWVGPEASVLNSIGYLLLSLIAGRALIHSSGARRVAVKLVGSRRVRQLFHAIVFFAVPLLLLEAAFFSGATYARGVVTSGREAKICFKDGRCEEYLLVGRAGDFLAISKRGEGKLRLLRIDKIEELKSPLIDWTFRKAHLDKPTLPDNYRDHAP
ncbi:MAG: hypothetical protein ACRBCJ_03335 [Hyphomicrobiaceae bacterium]